MVQLTGRLTARTELRARDGTGRDGTGRNGRGRNAPGSPSSIPDSSPLRLADMGRMVRLHYDPVVLIVEVDVDERKLVRAQIDWGNKAEGVVRPEVPVADELRAREEEARRIVDETRVTDWPTIIP